MKDDKWLEEFVKQKITRHREEFDPNNITGFIDQFIKAIHDQDIQTADNGKYYFIKVILFE